jgi:peptidoglycan/xylan/chitin deacetylase (PgdA/CDA1 family)
MKLKTILAGIAAMALAVPAAASASPIITINTPTATTYQQNANVVASYSCRDSQRRRTIVSCNGTVPNGQPINTANTGQQTFTVNATNDRGQGATKSVIYTVGGSTPPPQPGGWGGSCANGYVALTYDDGPSSLTQQYVDRLAANGANATFFLVGNQQNAFPGGASYEVSKGNFLADHTMSHPHLTQLSTSQWQFEIRNQQAITANIFGEYLFRPPYGESNGAIWDYSESLGMRETKWSLDTNDWQNPGAATVASRAGAMRNRDIILMHDGYQGTLDAMPSIFQTMQSKALCPGKIVASFDNPIFTSWGEPMYVDVRPF